MTPLQFPFSRIVGQEDLKLALLLVAVDPSIGGVLITGERGTAKSTAARALATLLTEASAGRAAPFVELPLGATEDRLVGALDITTVLHEGRTQLRSGLLAQADGGVLYVDEVNLLPDHLVDLLLDAAASGTVRIERDGLSTHERARFVLIGTMNPEEGNLRPQFLDRFALSVEVRNLPTDHERMAAVRSRLAFETASSEFLEAATPAEEHLRRQLADARHRLPTLAISDQNLSQVARIASEHQVAGIRADLAAIKAARALAAWERASHIASTHIERAAELAIPHRSRRKNSVKRTTPPLPPQGTSARSALAPLQSPTPGGRSVAPPPETVPETSTAPTLSLLTDLIDPKQSGRHGLEGIAKRRAVGVASYETSGTLAIDRTVVAAARRGARLTSAGVTLARSDLRQHDRSGAGRGHVLFLVDSSGSMAVQQRLAVAKGAASGLLASSRQGRDEVALMTFRAEGTDLVLPFTRELARVEGALAELPAGGRTPLAGALHEAARVLKGRDPAILVLFTDGRANVAMAEGDPWVEALAACRNVRTACAGALVIDCERGPVTLGRARSLAEALNAECVSLASLETTSLEVRIRRRMEGL